MFAIVQSSCRLCCMNLTRGEDVRARVVTASAMTTRATSKACTPPGGYNTRRPVANR